MEGLHPLTRERGTKKEEPGENSGDGTGIHPSKQYTPHVNLVKFKDYYKRETGKALSTWMYSVIIRSQVFEKVPGDKRTWKVMKTSEMITYKDFKEEYYRQLDKKREQLREWRHRS